MRSRIASRRSPSASTRSPCACCTRTSIPAHERTVARRPAGAWARRDVLARGLARVPRVRAHGDDGRQRAAACRMSRRTSLRSSALADEVLVMTSAGGLVPRRRCGRASGGVAAVGPGGRRAGRCRGRRPRADSPTRSPSTWVARAPTSAWCAAARPSRRRRRVVAGYPIRLPALDIHTIGAGGGSIAAPRPRRRARRRARERGRGPGPACYGRGGSAPTVTDADLVARPHPADAATFPGLGRLDVDAAARALRDAGVAADGVLAVVDAAMERGRPRGDGRAGRRPA